LAILPICFSCEHFMLFELAACAAGPLHQAPTLIGCWLLKIQLLAAGQARCIAVEAFCSSAAEKRDYGKPLDLRQAFLRKFLHLAPSLLPAVFLFT
ncbi:hypothetical protein, partial [Noviherbaspirillum aerium]|uniref:hypothetical protein n=1 Tax=Noviherbaspirillum aerium TaxID=2588497 RepID=UPI001CEFA16F